MKKIRVFLSAEATITVVGSVVCEVPDDMPDEEVKKALGEAGCEMAENCPNFTIADEGDFLVGDEATVDEWRIADNSDGPPDVRIERDGTLAEAQNPLGE